MLLLSRVDDPTTPVVAVPVDLHAVLEDVLDVNAVSALNRSWRSASSPPTGRCCALGDRDELDRICANLVSNAVKYTPTRALHHGHAGPDG